jgi:hypothetical protein
MDSISGAINPEGGGCGGRGPLNTTKMVLRIMLNTTRMLITQNIFCLVEYFTHTSVQKTRLVVTFVACTA